MNWPHQPRPLYDCVKKPLPDLLLLRVAPLSNPATRPVGPPPKRRAAGGLVRNSQMHCAGCSLWAAMTGPVPEGVLMSRCQPGERPFVSLGACARAPCPSRTRLIRGRGEGTLQMSPTTNALDRRHDQWIEVVLH